MTSFIHDSLVKQITDKSLDILKSNGKKKLFFNEKVPAGSGWFTVGVNDFGFVFMKDEISISWSLVSGQNLIKILNQIKNNEYYFK